MDLFLESTVRRLSVTAAWTFGLMFVLLFIAIGVWGEEGPGPVIDAVATWAGTGTAAVCFLNWVAALVVVWRYPYLTRSSRRRWFLALLFANMMASVAFGLVVLRRQA